MGGGGGAGDVQTLGTTCHCHAQKSEQQGLRERQAVERALHGLCHEDDFVRSAAQLLCCTVRSSDQEARGEKD